MILFRTPRCVIRTFSPKDLDRFMAYRNNLKWMEFQGLKGLTKQEYETILLHREDWSEGVQLAVAAAEDDSLIGDLYVRDNQDSMEIGFTIAPEYARQGYAAEAVNGLIDHIRRLTDKPVIAETDPDNVSAIRVLKKLSFENEGQYEGWLRFTRRS